MTEPAPYKEAFPVGTVLRIADRVFLDDFKATWEYHHKLTTEQVGFAGEQTRVAQVGFYHGGDALYTLAGIPGLWHEQCLRPA
jgi:hypothetical protein